MKIINYLSSSAIPIIIIIILLYGLFEKNKMYDTFIKGAKEGIDTVIKLFPTLLGIFIAAAGANQLSALISARKVAPLHWWVFVWPILLLCIGILILCHPMKSASLPFFILGIACIGYGFSDLFYALRLLYYRRQKEKEYVDFEVVEDSDTSAEGEAEVEL